jgi:hypothetical protein
MAKKFAFLMITALMAAPAWADKPERAGQGKPTVEQKAAHKSAMHAKNDADEKQAKPEKENSEKEKSGLEKQQQKKSEQIQKETGKGSEQGQASRENRKKWWKFWGE